MKTVTPKTSSAAVSKKRVNTQASSRKTVAAKKTTILKTTGKRVNTPSSPLKKASTVAPIKTTKPKKTKLVRDSFTIPKNEYEVIDNLKKRAVTAGQTVKKSELLRAGIKALAAMSDSQLKAALSQVPPIKTGRPKKAK